jgi:hypothetical protein|tara:strand:- start:408 stop:776 length:369 start_codon:yes stop_codon:yes gene_type:complete
LNKYRSGLEERVAKQLNDLKVLFEYETLKINYKKPERLAYYRPDFILPNGIIIEAKGRFLTKDRKKHRLIKEQFGDKYDIRFVFSNSKDKIGSKSKTTYALWCEKLGFKYCDCEIPTAWIKE